MLPPPFLQRVSLKEDAELPADQFPGTLPFVRSLDLQLTAAVTFFVGENGSGKSTLLEAIAELCALPVAGGGKNELKHRHGPQYSSELSPFVRPSFKKRPRDGYFFRAEYQAHFASLLDQREADPDFWGDPYQRFGGRSLHTRSHGEAFLEMFTAWIQPGIILMDEPEAALSPQRQLLLLSRMATLMSKVEAQFIIATHSPILLTYPGASLFAFDGRLIEPVALEDTSHYRITKGILQDPEEYWRVIQPKAKRGE
jgi:predicted ATPase